MIRHQNVARGFGGAVAPLAIESLAITMVKPAFVTLLVSAVSLAPLLAATLLAASITAVSVTTVAMRADEKQRSATIRAYEDSPPRVVATSDQGRTQL